MRFYTNLIDFTAASICMPESWRSASRSRRQPRPAKTTARREADAPRSLGAVTATITRVCKWRFRLVFSKRSRIAFLVSKVPHPLVRIRPTQPSACPWVAHILSALRNFRSRARCCSCHDVRSDSEFANPRPAGTSFCCSGKGQSYFKSADTIWVSNTTKGNQTCRSSCNTAMENTL